MSGRDDLAADVAAWLADGWVDPDDDILAADLVAALEGRGWRFWRPTDPTCAICGAPTTIQPCASCRAQDSLPIEHRATAPEGPVTPAAPDPEQEKP